MEPEPSLALVVDDDPDLRESIADVLTAAGYRTLTAENGKEAMRVLHGLDHPSGIMLLDLVMPVMDGWSFLEEYEKRPQWHGMTVVLLSASMRDGHMGRFARLQKPISLDRLLAAVSRSPLP